MIYYFDEIDTLTDEKFNIYYNMLPYFRKKKVDNLKFFEDKRLSTLAYLLLSYALKSEKVDVKFPIFKYGKYKKPYIDNIFFNISHCKTGVACSISDKNVGIDIEFVDKTNLCIIDSVMTTDEKYVIEKSSTPERTFTKFWVMKESYLKNVGVGLFKDLRTLNFVNVSNDEYKYDSKMLQIYECDNMYIGSCAYKRMELIKITMSELNKMLF